MKYDTRLYPCERFSKEAAHERLRSTSLTLSSIGSRYPRATAFDAANVRFACPLGTGLQTFDEEYRFIDVGNTLERV